MVGNSPGSANLGPKVFFIWGSFCILSLLFAYFLVPEMKGLSLEQVDKMMEEVSPRKSAAWVPHTTFAAEMRRINAAKAGIPPVPVGCDPSKGGGQQYHQQPYNDRHAQQFFQQYPQTALPQHYSHTPPPQQFQQNMPSPHQYQLTPPPVHTYPPPQQYHTPPPQQFQASPPPQQYHQHRPQQPYQRQRTY
jgi:FtsZ-interacting cell division protein ZipA